MKKRYLFLLTALILVFSTEIYGQTPRVYFDTVYATPPTTVTSSLYFENIPVVTTISILGHYKNMALQNGYITFLNPAFGSNWSALVNFGMINLAWFDLGAILTTSGPTQVMRFSFNYVQDSTILSFDPNNAVTTTAGITVPAVFLPGYVLQCPTAILASPPIDTVLTGNSTSFSVPPMGHTVSFQWQLSTNQGFTWTNISNSAVYSGVTSNKLNIVGSPGLNNSLYRCVTSGACIITSSASALIVKGPSLKGKLTYANTASTPIPGCQVLLKNGGVTVAQSNTDLSGNYLITGFPIGNYTIEAVIPKPWGGGNSADALLITKHFAGMITLTGLPLLAGDVNASGSLNSADALMVMKRAVGMISSFPAGDWIAENPLVNMTTPVVYTVNLKAICTGDVNGSYVP